MQRTMLNRSLEWQARKAANAESDVAAPDLQRTGLSNALETSLLDSVQKPNKVAQIADEGRNPLFKDMELYARNRMQSPDAYAVGQGSVGSKLESQLLSRLDPGGVDPISEAERLNFEADTRKSRAQLQEDLNRFGIIGGGVSGGDAAPLLGEFEGQVNRGLLDIRANQQRREDADMERAQTFMNADTQRGFQNRAASQQDLAQAAQLDQWEMGVDERRNLANRDIDFQNAANQRADVAAGSAFDDALRASQQRQGEFAADTSFRNTAADQVDREQAMLFDRQNTDAAMRQNEFGADVGFRNRASDLAQSALTADVASRMADRGQQANQFSQSLGMDQDRLETQDKQFLDQLGLQREGHTLNREVATADIADRRARDAEAFRQFQATMAQQGAQFGRQAGQEDTRIANLNQQFLASLGIDQQRQTLAREVATADIADRRDAATEATRQFQAQMGQQGAQFGRTANQEDTRLRNQQQQFLDQLGLQREGHTLNREIATADIGDRRDAATEAFRQFQATMAQQGAQFGRSANQEDTRLANQQQQFIDSLAEQRSQRLTDTTDKARDRYQQNTQFIDSLGLDRDRQDYVETQGGRQNIRDDLASLLTIAQADSAGSALGGSRLAASGKIEDLLATLTDRQANDDAGETMDQYGRLVDKYGRLRG